MEYKLRRNWARPSTPRNPSWHQAEQRRGQLCYRRGNTTEILLRVHRINPLHGSFYPSNSSRRIFALPFLLPPALAPTYTSNNTAHRSRDHLQRNDFTLLKTYRFRPPPPNFLTRIRLADIYYIQIVSEICEIRTRR